MRNRVSLAALCVALALACPARATVTSTASSASYTCTGAVTTYTIPFPYLAASQIVAVETDAAGVATTVIGTVKPSIAPTSGTLTLPSACPSGSTLTITRSVALTQPQSFRTGSYSGAAHEQAFDRLEMQIQQLSNLTASATSSGLLSAADWIRFNQTSFTSINQFQAAGTGAVPKPIGSKLGEIVSVRDFGATGNGTTDDTAAIQAALNTGKNVRGVSGDTYLVGGGLAAPAAGQVIDFSGCTVTLKSAAASKGILTLNGVGAKVVGGTWDLNVAGNATGDPYTYFAVALGADRTVAEGMYVKNSFGIGIKALAGVNYAEARFNRTENTALVGILFDGSTTVSAIGNSIHHNRVDISGNLSALGIYIASASPYTFVQRRWRIQDNQVIGPISGTTSASVAVTGRGQDGIVSGNHVLGTNIGISVDISAADESTVVANNRVEGANGPFAGGIEVNGAKALIEGNIVKGGRYGFASSSTGAPSTSTDWQQIIGNQFSEQTVNGMFVAPGTGHTAQHLNITGNTVLSTLTAQNGAVRLAGDCRYSSISGNVIKGPGSGSAGAVGVFLDSVNGNVQITSNRFESWLQASVAYNPAAVAQTQITFTNNDVSNDVGNQGAGLVSLGGLATAGTGIQIIGNFRGVSGTLKDDYLDVATNVRALVANTWTTPEGNLTAGPGSTYRFTATGSTNSFTKVSGTGNTGWVGSVPGTIALVAGTGTATVRSGASCMCTDTTAAAAVKCAVATTTLTATGTGTDVIGFVCF